MLLRKLAITGMVLGLVVIGLRTNELIYRTDAAQKTDNGEGQETKVVGSGGDSVLGQRAESKVRRLQEERLSILKEIAAEKESLYRTGRTTANELLPAKSAVLRAELELCGSDQARIVVLEKLVTNAKELEEFNETLFHAARVPRSEFLTAKANRLQAEIDLERVKAGSMAKPK